MPKSPIWSQEKYLSAFHFAAQAHRGQKYPDTGLPYLMHITFVAMETIAALEVEPCKDPDLAVQCALLHDVVEDTKVSKGKVKQVFGEEVADGVLLLTKNKKIKNKEKRFSEHIAQLLDAPQVIKMVKLADRISNLQAPPFHWDNEKIADYLEKSRIIQKKLGGASPYLNKRLKDKITNYTKITRDAVPKT
jgi:(p)ppGpp synthase/HD superfamily hydrolase